MDSHSIKNRTPDMHASVGLVNAQIVDIECLDRCHVVAMGMVFYDAETIADKFFVRIDTNEYRSALISNYLSQRVFVILGMTLQE